jgi:hypothetical protein
MQDDQIAFRLLALYQKLRRATDPQVRETLKGNIDVLLAELERQHRLRAQQILAEPKPNQPRSRR